MAGEGPGLLARLRSGLARTRQGMTERVQRLLAGRGAIDEDLYGELEAILIQADIGVDTTVKLLGRLRERVRAERVRQTEAVLPLLRDELRLILGPAEALRLDARPAVVMLVGVNGAGKTTTAGKLAAKLAGEGKKVLLAAADTFRAAAAEQLSVWAERAGAQLVRHAEGSDPAAVAFDALRAAQARGAEVVLVDTAGRLHTKSNLMEELKKITRVVAREMPGAPHEVLLVLDATTGQNALQQARLFSAAVGVTGVVLTKLDGTAKGGIVLAIRDALGIPVKLIGVGEGIEDLRPFDPEEFLTALFEGA